jgi:thioredoxin reductase (NADPH)
MVLRCKKLAVARLRQAAQSARVTVLSRLLNPTTWRATMTMQNTQGGALINTIEAENFTGFPWGIMGPDLMANFGEQAERFGAELGIDHEDDLSGRGVSWCATCDGFFFRDKEIAVVGGGDTALEEAVFLTRFAKSVTVVHRRDQLRASRIMVERAKANPRIHWELNAEVAAINGEGTVNGLTRRNSITGHERPLAVGGLFVAIGHLPRSDLVVGQVDHDAEGYIAFQGGTTSHCHHRPRAGRRHRGPLSSGLLLCTK